jgi:hypothetical protein
MPMRKFPIDLSLDAIGGQVLMTNLYVWVAELMRRVTLVGVPYLLVRDVLILE